MAERTAGWYRDPDDPSAVLHWGGRSWSGQRRSLPAWAVSDTDVVVDRAWGSLRPAAGGPVLEGPVRPTPLPAAARGSLAGRREGVRTQRLVRPTGSVGGTTRGPSIGVASSMQPAPGWVPARRPLMVFCALVGVAVLMMAATVVGVDRAGTVSSGTIGRDAGWVARAASVCQAGLVVLHAQAAAAPGDTSVLASNAERSSAAVGAVEQQLRAIPASTATGAAVGGWLDDLHNSVVDEEQLAITLGAGTTHGTGTANGAGAPSPAAGALQAQTIAMRVATDQREADAFADANGLGSCDLAPPASSSPLVAVP